MNNKEIKKWKEEYDAIKVPEQTKTLIEMSIKKAKEQASDEIKKENKKKVCKTKNTIFIRIAQIAAAFLIVFIVGANTSVRFANAMENIPFIGAFTRVITFSNYKHSTQNTEANIQVPKVELTDEMGEEQFNSTVDLVNKSVEEYTEMLMRQYEQDRKEIEEAGNLGHESIFSDYKIITNDSHLFTLRIDTTISQGGSINISKFYHIDKENDKIITLPDLFIVDSNYVEVLSSYIKAEMRQKMANDEGVSYFIDSEEGFTEWDFHQIKEDQNFYKNDKGNLVLVFDEYEVAPGYMGIVEFEIPYDIVKDIFISSL